MTVLVRTVALAAVLLAAVCARPGPAPQDLTETEGMDPLEVQGLLDEFQALSDREGERRRRRAVPDEQEGAFEPSSLDSASLQGLLDEFQADGDRERERRAVPEQPQEEAGPLRGLLNEFASRRARRAVPEPEVPAAAKDFSGLFGPQGLQVRVRREVEPLLLQGLKEFLGETEKK